ncbi:TetR/AcrR family transcriptional regulator [Burkholderia pseudomultivorans]|uniref:HTH tetR-type domain-containing protein n=1 Tax=Burkholderia pseudomultivorans TaxID=1207504 RepID=A0A6P2MZV3_9BURK|nr:TetR/AcrR family transcriptional regulator [Burkholderia pseudomultivorans]MDR8730115.1 hypothetical protein [Burkholderia pseudomultivorans]MDR8734700.1 hypothetical protein [Burkholderia pseudomultivorans]MDR8740666.1 hypothetical protein [Burkholderia pseudomultivorans]MDR8751669.1 hypothetical protein [Burkholderia pseudomultivorans]MDR8777080.1 hypothetical protein [Burkholderia pseudomultivorans]
MAIDKETPAQTQRRPLREKGVLRYNKLLDAAHELLMHKEIEEIGLYQVATQAEVPPASAYHFFPNQGAILLGLAERYHLLFSDERRACMLPTVETWQQWMTERFESSARLYNSNLPMCKLFLGSHTTRELVQSEAGFNEQLAAQFEAIFIRHFYMPFIRDMRGKFLVVLTLVDAVFSLSYTKHRHITPEFEKDAKAAAIGYLRTFLPEILERRPVPLQDDEVQALIDGSKS